MKTDSLHRAVQLLHDDVLQQLAAIQWCASELENRKSLQGDAAHALGLIAQAASAAMKSTRQVLVELQPQQQE